MHRWTVCAGALVSTLGIGTAVRAQTGALENLTGEDGTATRLSGFGVVDYRGDARSGQNTFDAGKLAVSAFRELNPHAWVFGQLTTSVRSGGTAGEDAATDVEIDNLIVSVTPARWSAVNLSAGKFDTPLGFERDDEPLNLQPTTSFNFELARPAKMVGVIGRWAAGRSIDVSAWLANGWGSDIDPNHGKTAGGRVGVRPSESSSVGAGFLYGPEGDGDDTQERYLLSADYAVQPTARWLVGGEANLGGDRANQGVEADRWYGATATVFRRLAQNLGTTARVEAFNDGDGARTGTPQTLTSVAFGPLYFVGVGSEGIFANVEHTTFRIPRLQLRGEVRFDHSRATPVDEDQIDTKWEVHYTVQLVTTF